MREGRRAESWEGPEVQHESRSRPAAVRCSSVCGEQPFVLRSALTACSTAAASPALQHRALRPCAVWVRDPQRGGVDGNWKDALLNVKNLKCGKYCTCKTVNAVGGNER